MTRYRRRDRATLFAVLLTGISCCTGTGVAHALANGTGGSVMPDVIAPSTGGTGFGDPNTRSLVARPAALLGTRMNVRGTMPGAADRRIVLQRLDAKQGWRDVARGRVRSSERFLVAWRADRSGRISLRVVLEPRPGRHSRVAAADAAAGQSSPVVDVTVYRPAMASFYGPGFFGNQTACGIVLTPETQGVAHRRLPCGTLVHIMYRGRETTVPVIDRGPFNGTYTWDLTQATADALGFQGGAIGYAREPAPAAKPPAA